MSAIAFAPYQQLADQLLPHAVSGDDGSHDIAHLQRVWKNARTIHAAEGGNGEILAVATLLHDCVAVEKNSPLRAKASTLAADKASGILRELGWAEEATAAVAHAILTHSFSAGIPPETLEGKILQDADRLDAIGIVGAARCFYIAGRMGSGLYDPADPTAEHRDYDDRRFAIDHFQTKLFKLVDGFNTTKGRELATIRQERLHRILEEFLDEI